MIARERFLAAVPPANFKPISPVIAVSIHEPYLSHSHRSENALSGPIAIGPYKSSHGLRFSRSSEAISA